MSSRAPLRRLALMVLAAVVASSAPARAQSLPPARVAVVDYQRVLQTSSAGQDIRRQIDSYRKTLQNQIKLEEEKLRAAEDELKRQRASLVPDEFQKRRRDFEDKVISLQRRAQDWMRELEDSFQSSMNKLHEPLLPLVQDLTRQRGYNIVIDHANILVVAKANDVTDDIIAQLNKKVPTVKVPKPKTR